MQLIDNFLHVFLPLKRLNSKWFECDHVKHGRSKNVLSPPLLQFFNYLTGTLASVLARMGPFSGTTSGTPL